jgi:butyryl-CoA dehydrogenase
MSRQKTLGTNLSKYYAARSFAVVRAAAERLLGAVAEGDLLQTQMAILRRLSKYEPINSVAIGRQIATAMIEAGRYAL